MKKALILVFISIIYCSSAMATDYYVSNTGNDSANGLSPSTAWKTIAKVNSIFSSLKPGDRILFNRGDTFYGTLKITKSGLAGSPIIIGDYGTGDNPIITGFTTISGWTNEGSGLYSKIITSETQTNMVSIDGINTAMGRWPNATYNTYESFSTNVSITDNGLGDSPNWTGAEVVIRKNDWTLDRCEITNHTGDVLIYTSLGTTLDGTANFGYFIQNDIRTLDTFGEWYHDIGTGKFYMFFGVVDPATKSIKVATLNYLVYNDRNDYITIDNMTFIGSIKSTIHYHFVSNFCVIQNCSITFAGQDGIRFSGSYGTINNNYVSDCGRAGIGTFYDGTNTVIINNTIKNIGIVKGQSKHIAGIWSPTSGIAVEYDNCLVQYNTIENVGYNGIQIAGNADILAVRNNFINNTCLVLDDGGGIYLDDSHKSIIIEGNIILNSIGNTDGTSDNNPMAEGIYLDESSSNITVRNNTVANCSNSGFKLHRAHDNTIVNNTSFNNQAGINFENWTGSSTIYNNKMNGNIFFAKTGTQSSLRFSSVANDISSFGTADSNYYTRPIDDDDVFFTYQPSTGTKLRTLEGWQSFTGQDLNSHKSPIAISNVNDILFEYNASKTNKVVTLTKPMIDVTGKKYTGSVTLLPYTSIILMVDPNPTQTMTPVYQSSVIENASPSILSMTYSQILANIIPAMTAFFVLVNGSSRNVSSVSISGTKVLLNLSSPVAFGDVVTLGYTKPSSNPLQTPAGGQAASLTTQSVTNNIERVNKDPEVSISNPAKGKKYKKPANITMDAVASDPDGTIIKVEFFNGTERLAELTEEPYSFTWKDVDAGIYSITARATDNLNATTISSPLVIEVEAGSFYDFDSEFFNLYPNPNNGQFTIDFVDPVQNEDSKVIITSSEGKAVYTGTITREEITKQFDMPFLKAGMYIIILHGSEIIVTKKFIKE